jgi:hypothetical protein
MIHRRAQRESFIVRIWREKGQSEWKGRVQHVPLDDSVPLKDLQDLAGWHGRPARHRPAHRWWLHPERRLLD